MDIIKKIILDLGGKEVELTTGQAKKLKEALDEMFGKEIVKEIHHYDYWQWYPYKLCEPNKPYWETYVYSPTTCGTIVSYNANDSAMTLKVA